MMVVVVVVVVCMAVLLSEMGEGVQPTTTHAPYQGKLISWIP